MAFGDRVKKSLLIDQLKDLKQVEDRIMQDPNYREGIDDFVAQQNDDVDDLLKSKDCDYLKMMNMRSTICNRITVLLDKKYVNETERQKAFIDQVEQILDRQDQACHEGHDCDLKGTKRGPKPSRESKIPADLQQLWDFKYNLY